MRTFLLLYSRDCEGDDDGAPYKSGKSPSSERRSFTQLSSVCWYWHQTLTGWPESPTCHWFRHKLKKLIECECVLPMCSQNVSFLPGNIAYNFVAQYFSVALFCDG